MVTVTVFKNSAKEYTAVQAVGHAGFSEKGTDIVCAAVSVLFINTLNAIESLTTDKQALGIVQNEEDGILYCGFKERLSKESVLLLDAMVLGMSGIQEQYSTKYMRLQFEEV